MKFCKKTFSCNIIIPDCVIIYFQIASTQTKLGIVRVEPGMARSNSEHNLCAMRSPWVLLS